VRGREHDLLGQVELGGEARDVVVLRADDEESADWYTSLRRAASGTTPDPAGPQVAQWRRVWESSRSPEPAPARRRAWLS
jgi:hypothetical protein